MAQIDALHAAGRSRIRLKTCPLRNDNGIAIDRRGILGGMAFAIRG